MCRSFQKAESGYVRLELEVPRSASIGVYARRNALPTHTNYDIAEVVRGFEDRLAKRGIKVTEDLLLKHFSSFLSVAKPRPWSVRCCCYC